MTKKVAVAMQASAGHEIDDVFQFEEGDKFDILEEPIDVMTAIVFGQLKGAGDLERAEVIHISNEIGFIVMFTEDSDLAFNFNDFFIKQEE